MVRILLLAGLLLGAFYTQAEARTVRYEFDVVGSVIDYQRIDSFSSGSLAPGSSDYDAYVAAYHPLAHLVGQTGRTVVEVQDYDDWVNGGFASARINCLSGLFCPFDSGGYTTSNKSTGFSIYGGQFYWSLSGNTMTFSDDGGIAGWGDLNGVSYLWWDPRATFTLANLTISDVTGQTQIASTPLPAALWLYAGLGLLLLRRRG